MDPMEAPAMDDLGKADDRLTFFFVLFLFSSKKKWRSLNKFSYAGTGFVIVCPEEPEGGIRSG